MDTPTHDVIVIGAGPAGLTAATEVARAGLKCLCLDKLAPGGVLINLGELHDFDEIFTGTQMASLLTDDAAVAGVEIGFGEVTKLSGSGPGSSRRPMASATRPAPSWSRPASTRAAWVFPTKTNTKARASPTAPPAMARFTPACRGRRRRRWLGRFRSPGVDRTCRHRHRDRIAAGRKPEGITFIDGRIVGLEGNNGLQSIVVESGTSRNTISASAVFVYVGQSPAAEFLPETLARDASGHIVIDEVGRTSAPAVLAAGDVRAGRP